MENNETEKKVCPLLYSSWLSYSGRETQNEQDFKCLGASCAFADPDNKQCAILTIAKNIGGK